MFRTVSDELIECATAVVQDFRQRGFTVSIEKHEIGFPYTPTLYCRRKQTRIIIEVMDKISATRMHEWVAYGHSAGQDFQVAICLPQNTKILDGDLTMMRNQQIGVYLADATIVREQVAPVDLGINVTLPEIKKENMKVRRLLGRAYDHFNNGHWREGFEAACQGFEDEARRYMKRHIKSGRIRCLSRGRPNSPTDKHVNRLSMGQLGELFAMIISPNHADSLIGETLKTVNKDRINVVHRTEHLRTEKRLRQNVGRHMWSLMNAVKEVVN